MQWATVQQIIRILMYSGGAAVLGEGVASGEMYQAAIGGVANIGAFIWWYCAERKKLAK